jgi:hypothetical protein
MDSEEWFLDALDGPDTDTDTDTDTDDLLILMYLEYLFCIIYIEKITEIQRFWRGFQDRKKYQQLRKSQDFQEIHRDVIELAYVPPNPKYPILKNGGFQYREARDRFDRLKS